MQSRFVAIPGQTQQLSRVAAAREDLGLSVAAAAEALGVHRSTLLRWERGERPMPADARQQLADVCARQARLADDLVRAVAHDPELTVTEWRRRVGRERRRLLRRLLADGRLVLMPSVRVDAAGRRYVRSVVTVPGSGAVRGVERSAPATVSGAQLGAARRFAGITADQLAGRIGVAPSTIRDMETSRAVPRARVGQLADALDLAALLSPEQLRTIRDGAGWSRRETAARVGVHQSVLARWEADPDWRTGGRRVPRGRLLLLAAAMHEAATTAPQAVAARRSAILDAIVADVATYPGTTRGAVLHRHRRATVGRYGPHVDGAVVLAEAIRRGTVVEAATTTGKGRGRRTILGLFLPTDAAAPSPRKRITGSQLADARWRAGTTRRQLATATGASAGTIQQIESLRSRPVPLHWELPLRQALAVLEQEGTADEKAVQAILGHLEANPGTTRWRLHRDVCRALGSIAGKTKAATRALRELEKHRDVVEGAASDSLGRTYWGLYRRQDLPRPAERVSGSGLRSLREQRGWSAAQLAAAIGVRPGRLTRWERGERGCPPDALAAIRAALAAPRPPTIGRQLRRLLDLASRPGGVATGELPTSFFTPAGRETVRRAVADRRCHVEERLATRRDGRTYVRRHLVAGPAPDGESRVDRMAGAELRSLREAADLTQVALGRLVGERNTRVWAWESGRQMIPPGRVAQLRAALAEAAGPPPG